jgi:hypothetical protein
MLTSKTISVSNRTLLFRCVLYGRTKLINSKYVIALCLMIEHCTNKVLSYLYICMFMLLYFFCILGPLSEMSGGNLGRSRSLTNIRCLRGSTNTISGGLSFFSEAEGLELLSQDSPGDPSQESHLNALEHVTGLLDYESDGQEQEPNVREPASSSLSAEDPQFQAAMDVEPAGSSQSPVKNVMDSVYYQCRSARISC